MPTHMPSIDRLDHRTARIGILERFKGEDDAPRFRVSISSEEPVQRDGFIEILDHTAGAVEMRRALAGLPLLFNHDHHAPIGVIESVRLVNKRLEGVARFGKSRDASERLADVQAGTLRNISVGYVIHETRPEAGGIARASRWEPYEASLVSIPADPTVGINRSFQEASVPHETETRPENTAKADRVRVRVRVRVREIMATGRHFNISNAEIDSAIESGISVADFGRRVLDHLGRESAKTAPITGGRGMMFGAPMIARGYGESHHVRDFSIARAAAAQITGDWSRAGLEREMSQEIAHRAGRKPEGVFVPSYALAKRFRPIRLSRI